MVREKIVALRLSGEEKSRLDAYAKSKHINVAALVRQIIMNEVDNG